MPRIFTDEFFVLGVVLAIWIFLFSACSTVRVEPDYHSPNEKYIDIQGSLSPELVYKVMVRYVAKGGSKRCKRYSWSAGMYVSRVAEFEYQAAVKDGHHSLRIPLKELSPDTACKWAPDTVFLCVDEVGKDPVSCSSLFFLHGRHDNNPEINMECSGSNFCFRNPIELHTENIDVLNKTYTVNITRLSG